MRCTKLLEVAGVSENYGVVTFCAMTFTTVCWVRRGISNTDSAVW